MNTESGGTHDDKIAADAAAGDGRSSNVPQPSLNTATDCGDSDTDDFHDAVTSLPSHESDDSTDDDDDSGDDSAEPVKDVEKEVEENKDEEDVRIREEESRLTEDEKQDRMLRAQDMKAAGNDLFKQSCFDEAVEKYSDALRMCPRCFEKQRSVMFSNRAACRLRQERHEDTIADCTEALKLDPNYVKALLRRAESYEKTEKLDEALQDYQCLLELDPTLTNAQNACRRLPEEIQIRNEKMKEEMIGKLKELGNMVLKPFGLSTNNFQMKQDPETGSYSMNFQQNPK